MYSAIISSVTFPELATKYPRAHRCCPQNCRRNSPNSSNIFLALRPFNLCTRSLIAICGGTDTNKCTWSGAICPFTIWTSCDSHACLMSSPNLSPIPPRITFFRYFVIQTMWYFKSYTVCEPFRYSAILLFYAIVVLKTARLKAGVLDPIYRQ